MSNSSQNEWDLEPNLETGVFLGFQWVISRHPKLKHLCGYVGIPSTHPWYDLHEGNLYDIECHGGITYASDHPPEAYPDGPKGLFWIGFDCAHSGDYAPGAYIPGIVNTQNLGVYRNMAYVKKEVGNLAELVFQRELHSVKLEEEGIYKITTTNNHVAYAKRSGDDLYFWNNRQFEYVTSEAESFHSSMHVQKLTEEEWAEVSVHAELEEGDRL